MSNIITWPNVNQDNVTYISYDLDFKNLKDKIEYILNNDRKRKELVSNSQEVLRNVYKDEGKKLIQKFDGEYPIKYENEFYDYISIKKDEFIELTDKFRPDHLWEKKSNRWVLKKPID